MCYPSTDTALCLQPDNGSISAYWISALISIVEPASGTGPEYLVVALRALCTAMYIYTGRVVPRSQRRRLCATLRLILRNRLSRDNLKPAGSRARLFENLALTACMAIWRQVFRDAAFADFTIERIAGQLEL
jgi:hypothetical protein